MGKKSKRTRAKAGGRAMPTGGAGATPIPVASLASEASFLPPTFAADVPENGWARDLRYAERELRRDRRSADAVVRVARAARVLRRFDRLEEVMAVAESKGIAIGRDEDSSLWNQWKEDIQSSRRVTCMLSPKIQEYLDAAMEEDLHLDVTNFGHERYSNLNCLQFSASMGDIQLLEKFVSLGAALDYASDDIDDSLNSSPTTVKKPVGSTALLLAVIEACIYRRRLSWERGNDESTLRDFYEGQVECAIQLVRLGANVDVTLNLPPGRDAKSKVYQVVKQRGWVGKSVRELAHETGSELLVQTVQSFDAEDTRGLVNCRCGSRLPWKKCHAGKKSDCYYSEKYNAERILWRYSPLAKCPCRNTNKQYFKCCWEEAAFREHYLDDESGEIRMDMRSTLNVDGRELNADMFRNLMGQFSPEENLKFTADAIRKVGLPQSHMAHPKSKIFTWDPFVYAGTMEAMFELINDYFQWNDAHWNIPKRELLKRMGEWNDALRKYCDKEGLEGAEREKVIKFHTATPFAFCANSNCDNVETEVKQFRLCSRCEFVGYCSKACLDEDFQFHKPRCTKMGQY